MKQIIVMIATLPILLVLLMQITQSQVMASNLKSIEYYCLQAEREASIEGYFPEETVTALKMNIAARLDISEEDVIVTYTDETNIKYRMHEYDPNNLIYYKVEFTIPKVMAGHRLFGILDENNQADIVIERTLMSEKMAP
jgi:pyruvate kinase